MSIPQRGVLCLAVLTAWTTVALSQQAPPAPATTPAAPTTAPQPAKPDRVLATVNNEPVHQSEVERMLSQLSVQPGDEDRAYESVMTVLVNNKLLGQFLNAQKVQVSPDEVNQVVAQYEKAAKDNNDSLINQLAQSGMTMDALRDLVTKTLQWRKYVEKVATEPELKKYAEVNKDTFSGTRVRASHILIQIKPDASAAEKQKAKEKLLAIKKEITDNKISFADAANKYSEDPGNNETPSGGDLNYFLRKEPFIESFSSVAFGLKKGQISDPIETEYGFHLIQVTDRVEGQPMDFAKSKDEVLFRFAQELQTRIVNDQRKKAEAAGAIKIQPMPPGLVETDTEPPAGAAPAPAPGTAPAPGAAKSASPAPKAATPAPAPAPAR